jgi:phospholipid/cholesterol/gamma-HCH transport system substrate-binding protein
MKPFRERNPLPIGIIGVILILAFLALGLDAGKLPFVNTGHTVHAQFRDAAGLQKGDNVRVAGVLVGKVDSVKLSYNPITHDELVDVAMKVNSATHVDVGSRADIKIETLLGQVYIALRPSGTTPLRNDTILAGSTSTPTSITTAFNGLGERAGAINVNQLAKSFDVLSSTFANTPASVRGSLVGLERLSMTISSRDAELKALLGRTNVVTNTLASHDAQVAKLINDSNLILKTVDQQRTVIHTLLIDTTALSKQLTGLVADNRAAINPALSHLKTVIDTLNANQAAIYRTLQLAGPFVRLFSNTIGNGKWFDTYVANLGPFAAQVKLPAGLLTSGTNTTGLLGGG